MQHHHHYAVEVKWTGNLGQGTSSYSAYERSHVIAVQGKAEIPGSSDPKFRGDPLRYNPEELLVAALSTCHMLWYLHLCAVSKVVVEDYRDTAGGLMVEGKNGGGQFTEVTLRPEVVVSEASMIPVAERLHEEANRLCFIANSCNFPIRHAATTKARLASSALNAEE